MSSDVLGRDLELGAVDRLLLSAGRTGLTFVGEAGIGKSTLWETALARARSQRQRVLQARVGEAGATFGFSVLADLFAEVDLGDIALTPPVRQAVAAAMLKAVPVGPIAASAVARGTTDILQALASTGPLLVAVDDVQWCDAESAQVLAHAVLGVTNGTVQFLFTRRSGHPMTPIESALRRQELDVVAVRALSPPDVSRLLTRRLELRLPRWLGMKVADHSRGNPLFALELGRVLRQRRLPPFGAPLAVPADLTELLSQRVEDLLEADVGLLLASAAEPTVTDRDLIGLAGAETLARAVAERILVIDTDTGRVRPAHPLLGAAAWAAAGPEARRSTHRSLAAALGATERGVRHRALGSQGYDEALAGLLDNAAEQAGAAGRTETAVELARLALDRSAPDSPDRAGRVVGLAERLSTAGAATELTRLLEQEMTGLPAGEARARAWLLAADGDVESIDQFVHHIDRAILEAARAPRLRAEALSLRATVLAVTQVERIDDAVRLGAEAVDLDPTATCGLSWARAIAGLPDPDPVDDLGTASRHSWRGDVTRSRALLTARIRTAEESGDHGDFLLTSMLLAELELRAGCLGRAEELLDLVEASGYAEAFESPDHLRLRARLAALRGDSAAAEQWLAAARPLAQAVGSSWVLLDMSVTEGLIATAVGDPARAAAAFGEVWERCQREGVANPGTFPVALELVAARLGCGAVEPASQVTTVLSEAAAAQRHPWALAVTKALEALHGTTAGTVAAGPAAAAATEAAVALTAMGLTFDAARTLTVVGAALRRRRQWGHARRLLDSAAAQLHEIGATGWSELVEAELARVGGHPRRPAGSLTPAELTTAGFAAEGLSNQQVARRTGTSVRTVETHLSRAYEKLGITARTQLGAALAARKAPAD